MRDTTHAAIFAIAGGLIGGLLVGFFFIAKPMKRNYAECGTIFLCKKS